MKTAGFLGALLLSSLWSAAQSVSAAPPKPQPASPALSSILAEIQRTAQATNTDLSRLQIDKWKTDSSQRQQMQQVADSLKRNISSAVPGLISEVQAASDSVSRAFKLYHNLNVVYEFLNSLTDAAGTLGRKEEYDPLAADVSALDRVRQNLSAYLEQSTGALETQLNQTKAALAQAQASPQPVSEPPKKIIVDNGATAKKTAKATKKKAATPADAPNPPQ